MKNADFDVGYFEANVLFSGEPLELLEKSI